MANGQEKNFQLPDGTDPAKEPLTEYRTGEITDDEEYVDPDDEALKAAEAEAAAEEAGQQPGGQQQQQDPGQQTQQQQQPQNLPQNPEQNAGQPGAEPGAAHSQTQNLRDAVNQGQTGQPGADPIMIPKARFDQAINDARTALAERDSKIENLTAAAGYLKARADMLETQLRTTQSQEQQAQQANVEAEFDQRLQAEDDKLKAAATAFDDGKTNLTDFLQVQREVEAAKVTINQERVAHAEQAATAAAPANGQEQNVQQPQQQTPRSLGDEHVLETQIQTLVAQHPYLHAFSREEMGRLQNMVHADFAAQGRAIPPGAAGDYMLRAEVAKLTDLFGPSWHPEVHQNPTNGQAQPNGGNAGGQQQGQQTQLSDAAKARLAKAQLAADLPPDPNQFGTSGGGANPLPTEEQIMQMSEEQMEALPAAMLDRLGG